MDENLTGKLSAVGTLTGVLSPGQVVAPNLQIKTAAPSTTAQNIEPDEGYDGLSMVQIRALRLRNKTVSASASSAVTVDKGSTFYDGLGTVTVEKISLQSKTVDPGDDPQTITADAGYQGLASVQVGANIDTLPYWLQRQWREQVEIAAPNSWSPFCGLAIADLVLTDWDSIMNEAPGLRANAFTQKLTLKNCGGIAYGAFRDMTALTECVIESSRISTIDIRTFEGDTALQTVKLSDVTRIHAKAFYGCTSLSELFLQSSTMCTLSNTSAFDGTQFASGVGAIHVPASLLSDYQSATNWSVFADRFVGDL